MRRAWLSVASAVTLVVMEPTKAYLGSTIPLPEAATQLRLSPNGGLVSYVVSDAGGQFSIEAVAVDCRQCRPKSLVKLAVGEKLFTYFWMRDGKHLVYSYLPAEPDKQGLRLLALDLKTGRAARVFPDGVDKPVYVNASPVLNYFDPQIIYGSGIEGDKVFRLNPLDGQVSEDIVINDEVPVVVVDSAKNAVIAFHSSGAGGVEWIYRDTDSRVVLSSLSQDDLLNHSQFLGLTASDGPQRALFITSEASDTPQLVAVELKSGNREVLSSSAADYRKVLLHPESRSFLGVADERLVPEWTSLDERAARAISGIPHDVDEFVDILGFDAGLKVWLFSVNSPRHEPRYGVLRKSGIASLVASAHPRSLVGRVRPLDLQSRDGEILPSYLGYPSFNVCAQGYPCPLVVLIHGGPRDRDHFDWNATASKLQDGGYAVLRINYRGSAGFGKRFKDLGRGQWGGKMQDDLVDAILQVLDTGDFDRERVAAIGGSHGGYLALNLMRSRLPGLRCTVALSATADLKTFVEVEVKRYPGLGRDLYDVAGDPRTSIGAATLWARSPASEPEAYAGKAVLLVNGSNDRSTPVSDIREFGSAISRAGAAVLEVEFPGEGHVLSGTRAQPSYETLMFSFLNDCLDTKGLQLQALPRGDSLNYNVIRNTLPPEWQSR